MSAVNPRVIIDLRALQKWARAQGRFIEMEDRDTSDGLPTVVLDIAGPADTPYAGGVFRLRCQLPHDYPLSSPSVRFLTRMWHPNIEHRGAVCLDVLGKRWSCATTLLQVFSIYIPELLKAPEPNDPFNGEAAHEMITHPSLYTSKVVQYVRKYAKPADSREEGEGGGSGGSGGAATAAAAVETLP